MTVAWHQKRRRGAFFWPLAVLLLVLGLGIWGFASLAPAEAGRPGPPPLPLLEAVYRTARLFTLNLDVPDGTVAQWPLWVAAFSAPLLRSPSCSASVELDAETTRHLARHHPLRRVLILTPTDLDGGGIAITLARHLGRSATIEFVTEGGPRRRQ